MTKILSGASMSLDGYVAGPDESGFDRLFAWYGNGEVEIATAMPDLTMHLTQVSADHWRDLVATTGALVVGRHLFDITSGWGGRHPMDVPVVVLTHSVPDGWARESDDFVFVTEGGIEAAVAKARELAPPDKHVVVNSGQMATQAIQAGLLEEIGVDLVPVLLGGGTPFFDRIGAPVDLEGPISAVQGKAVTHLRYRVVRQ